MLTLENVNVYYGGIHALRGVSLRVEAGEVVTLIGANGAGKSTTLRAITGLLTPRSGRIRFEGADITGLPAHQLVGRISMAPEGRGSSPIRRCSRTRNGRVSGPRSGADPHDIERAFTCFQDCASASSSARAPLSGGEQQCW
jgi:branched-chain amino acid transport system ATP-binding protein